MSHPVYSAGRFIGGLLLITLSCIQPVSARQPNVVFILIDDMGWSDLGCTGSDFYETPSIDRLASGGMKFSQAYAACQVCSPTRASILTGKYPARLQLTNFLVGLRQKVNSPVLTAPYTHQLHLGEVTLAEVLAPAGYTAAHMGKWHLGDAPYLPENQGFALNVSGNHVGMVRSFFYPQWKASITLEGKAGDYLGDRLTDEAVKYLADHKDKPFFLYLPYYEVHIPLDSKPELLKKYQAKQPGARHRNPHYAAMIEALDTCIGRVLNQIDALGLAEETIVVFTSDNGGMVTPEGPHTPATNNAPLQMGKGYMYEGGTRVPLLVRWPENIRAGSECDTPVTSVDFFPTLLELTGATMPEKLTLDGVSLAPLLLEQGELAERDLFWHYPHFSNQGGDPAGAIRSGDYKLIEWFEDGRLELFNLAEDAGEKVNLATQQPDRTRDLHARLMAWRKQVDATMPPANPAYQPSRGVSPKAQPAAAQGKP